MPSSIPPSGSPSVSPSGQSPPPSSRVDTPDDHSTVVSMRVRNGMAITIVAIWAVGIIADALSADFVLSPFVYLTLIGLASSVFGANFVKGLRG